MTPSDMLRDTTQNYICGLTDEELSSYIEAGTDVYEPDAIAFARAELGRRNLDPRRLRDLQSAAIAAVTLARLNDSIAADSELDRDGRVLAFVCGAAILSPIWFFVWLRLLHRREYRKARDMWRFGLLGLGSQLAILIGPALVFASDFDGSFGAGVTAIVGGCLLLLLVVASTRVGSARLHGKTVGATCPTCGYDLRTTPSRCPECGRVAGQNLRGPPVL